MVGAVHHSDSATVAAPLRTDAMGAVLLDGGADSVNCRGCVGGRNTVDLPVHGLVPDPDLDHDHGLVTRV